MQYLYFADELSQIVTTMLNILVFVPTQLVHRVDFVFYTDLAVFQECVGTESLLCLFKLTIMFSQIFML